MYVYEEIMVVYLVLAFGLDRLSSFVRNLVLYVSIIFVFSIYELERISDEVEINEPGWDLSAMLRPTPRSPLPMF